MLQTLADLEDSIETKIVRAVTAILRGGTYYDRAGAAQSDSFFAEAFRPIVMVDVTATAQRRLFQFAQGTLAVVTGLARARQQPSDRTTLAVSIFIVAYLPAENLSEDSAFNGSNICGKLRELLTQAQELRDETGEKLTFQTLDFQLVDAVIPEGSGTLIVAYRAIYETDVQPSTGDLI